MSFHDHFEIDIIGALSDQLECAFGTLTVGALNDISLQQVKPEQGVYILFLESDPVYVGKADKGGGLRKRPSEHLLKLSGRRNINLSSIGFKALYVHKNWTSLAPEEILIKHLQQKGHAAWNGIGFGPHDPGRDRETTAKPPQGFDSQFPIREDWPMSNIEPGSFNARDLLMKMKADLPFVFRYETKNPKRWRNGHPLYNDISVRVPSKDMPARELLRLVARSIPGAQATVFVSHFILYFERREYPHGEVIWPDS